METFFVELCMSNLGVVTAQSAEQVCVSICVWSLMHLAHEQVGKLLQIDTVDVIAVRVNLVHKLFPPGLQLGSLQEGATGHRPFAELL